MSHMLTLCAAALPVDQVSEICTRLQSRGLHVDTPAPLHDGRAVDIPVHGPGPDALHSAIAAALGDAPIDYCLGPVENRRKQVLVADMDSTIITKECLDELADYAGVKPEIAAITERAMAGELDFEGALRERLSILANAGIGEEALQQCYDERIVLSDGARVAVTTMAQNGALTALVSGGFTFFTTRVMAAAGFAETRANTLVFEEGRLTGVADPILGADAKLQALKDYCAQRGCTPAEALCIGDGANDRIMVEAAGLGIAYKGHEILRRAASARIDHTDLVSLLYFQGYTEAEIAWDA